MSAIALGDFATATVIDFHFTTIGTAGTPTTLSGTPAISVYKGNSTTESTAGVTLDVDFDSRTGFNHVRVDTSADGTFYASGGMFSVTITTGTVGGTSVVGYVVGRFTLNATAALKPATAGRTIAVDASGFVTLVPSHPAITFASVTCTGEFKISDGWNITVATTDKPAIQATGNGAGQGAKFTGGASADGLAGYGGSGGNAGAYFTGPWGMFLNSTTAGYAGLGAQAQGAGGFGIKATGAGGAGYDISANIAGLTMTESYAALHAVPTLAQWAFEVRGLLAEAAVSSVTLTVNGIDGATAKETFTLNSATNPTSITRAT